MKTTMKIAVIAMMGMSLGVSAQEIIKNDSEASYPTLNSKGDIFQYYRNVNQTLEFGIAGKMNTRRSWILSRHYDLSGKYGKYYSTLHLQPDTGDKSQYKGIAIGYPANQHIETGAHLAVNGNVGIGTTKPRAQLHLNRSVSNESYPSLTSRGDIFQLYTNVNQTLEFGVAGKMNTRRSWILSRHYDLSGKYGKYYSTLHLQPDTGDKSQYKGIAIGYPANQHIETSTHLAVNGKVGIGTVKPDMELTVNGKIHAKEVKIDLAVPAPDYVFKSDYKLRSIEEVENFIKEHSHLPEIPSAKEFAKNGVMQAEMDMNLLKKIEELTLYTIDQQKEIEILKKQNSKFERQEKKIERLESLVQKLLRGKN